MAKLSDLMAFGFSPFAAGAIVGDVADGLTATGSTQGTALQLSAVTSIVTTTAASTGVRLPAMNPGDTVEVANLGANALLVYPLTGGTIQGGAANAGFSVAAGKTAFFTARSTALNSAAFLSA